MPYDGRLISPTATFDPDFNASLADNIELGPWETRGSDLPDPLPHAYRSSDKLLRSDGDGLENLSPRNSVDVQDFPVRYQGWYIGAIFSVSVVALTLVLNLIVTTWAVTHFGISDGIGTINQAPCHTIKTTGLWLHIAINVLSTALLGASNYCMQCLCSPTKLEVERAHARKAWLDIGIQSFRNLTKIRRGRMMLWLFLAASSIPLHLMFNSAIFVSLTANEYIVATVSEAFVNGAPWTLAGWDDTHQTLLTEMQQNISSLERLDRPTCMKEYGVDYLSARRHALVVSGEFSTPLLGILDWNYTAPQNSWVCGTTLGSNSTLKTYSIDYYDCTIGVALKNETWVMADQPVEYCLSQRVKDQCRLQFAMPILVAVLVCNFVKLLCISITIWKFREPTFVTLGDALSALLGRPDPSTAGMCIASKKDFEKGAWPEEEPKRWTLKRHFRFEAVGIRRFVLTNVTCAIAVIGVSVILRFAIGNTTTSSDIATLWRLGFGTVTASALVRWEAPIFGSNGLMKNVLIANSPQLLLSLLYIIYNRMYTCMSFSKEWHSLAHNRQPLRVTSPRGDQRSTYFLSLPYRYLIAISVLSAATHWILSQSLFLVAIDVYDFTGTFNPSQSILTCGFSCIALIFLIGIGWLVFITGVGMGFRRYEAGMPLAGSCSAALSAACHPPQDEPDVALMPVKWGVTSIANGVGHCSLSGRYVSPPITWRLYTGQVKE